MSGQIVRAPRTDCPATGRRTHSLSIESVRPLSGPPEKEEGDAVIGIGLEASGPRDGLNPTPGSRNSRQNPPDADGPSPRSMLGCRLLLRIREVADMLALSERQVWSLIGAGDLHPIRPAGIRVIRVARDDVAALVLRWRQQSGGSASDPTATQARHVCT